MGIPAISWDGKEDLQQHAHLSKLEAALNNGIGFSSSQAGITTCLESLGSRFQPISVIMPVNAPYDALMGVIRSNARPIITTIDLHTFQSNVDQVKEALQSLPEAVVYLHRPGGLPVEPELLEAIQDVPTICDTRLLPVEADMKFTFNIYDISVMVGDGAFVYTKQSEIRSDLIQIRADSRTELSEVASALAFKRKVGMLTYPNGDEYSQLLDISGKSGILGFSGPIPNPTYLIQVEDAYKVRSKLYKKGIETAFGCIPVYKYPIARKRWTQEPNYLVAEQLHNQLVLLPNSGNINRSVILEEIWT